MSKWDKQNRINKQWRARNKEQVVTIMRALHYRRKYNTTIADYDLMYAIQDGRCAMCGRQDNYDKQHFDIDHDHYSGKARGLLCRACNRLLGRAEHLQLINEDLLKKIEKYLTGRVEFDIMYIVNDKC